MQPDGALVYDLCTELSITHNVSDAMFARAKAILSDQQIVDLMTLSGTYVTVAMMLATGREATPDGSTPLPMLASGTTAPVTR
jgi:4-carboxymuconolactone decarboxylase